MVFKSPEKTILPVMETVQSQSVIGDSQYKEIFATKQGKEKENKYNSKSHKPPRPNAKGANASAWRYPIWAIISIIVHDVTISS